LRVATIGRDLAAGNEGGFGACEEDRDSSDLISLAEPAQRDLTGDPAPLAVLLLSLLGLLVIGRRL
jgi:hypothetical protein